MLIENILVILLCFTPYMIRGIEIVPGFEDYIFFGPLYFVYVAHISIPFLVGHYVLFRKMRRSVGKIKKQIAYMLAMYLLSSSVASFTNLLLPWLGYFELNWVGQSFSTMVAIATTYAILKHNLLNIRLLAADAFILFLNLLLLIQFVFSATPERLIINAVVLIAVLFISGMLRRSVIKEIERRRQVSELAKSLEKANFQLQEIDKQKTDFLSIAAHQLRTPMSIFNGYLELLQEGAYGKVAEEAKSILSNMDESNGRLVKLVDSFLDITRLEQGRTKYEFKEQDINLTIGSVVKELNDRAKQKNIVINWKPEAGLPKVQLDEEKIRHVIFNFVDNAIKYSEFGEITIHTNKEKSGISFRVKDNGIGFNKVDEANFFQKFYRGNNVQGMNVNGTGLGLYVCRMFVEAHHGKVWAHSHGLGRGSEFGFWVPYHEKK